MYGGYSVDLLLLSEHIMTFLTVQREEIYSLIEDNIVQKTHNFTVVYKATYRKGRAGGGGAERHKERYRHFDI